MEYRRISADCHLDLCWMPPEVFVSGASKAMKDRVPHVVDGPEGPYWTSKNCAMLGFVGGANPHGAKWVKGQHPRLDAMGELGLYSDAQKGINRVSDPHRRIELMERDGIDAEVIFGILGGAMHMNDPEAANEMLRIYNDWLKGFCAHYPDRQIGLACIPVSNVAAAVAEVRRVAKLGLRGIEIPLQYDSKPLWHEQWDTLWQALTEVELPVHFHGFPSMPYGMLDEAGARRPAALFTALSTFQVGLFGPLSSLIGGGVLERYPQLRVSFGEIGLGWLPYALHRMDLQWTEQQRFRTFMKLKPSEYWARQCRASFQYDPLGAKLVDLIGVDTLMWGCDFPHGDGTWPDSDKIIADQFSGLPPEKIQKITCDNAVSFYRLAA